MGFEWYWSFLREEIQAGQNPWQGRNESLKKTVTSGKVQFLCVYICTEGRWDCQLVIFQNSFFKNHWIHFTELPCGVYQYLMTKAEYVWSSDPFFVPPFCLLLSYCLAPWCDTDFFPLLSYMRASLVAQLVKNLPAVQETWVWSLGWEDPLKKRKTTHSVFWPGEFHGLYGPWGRKQLDTNERLSRHVVSYMGL